MNKLASITEQGQTMWHHWWDEVAEHFQSHEHSASEADQRADNLLAEIMEAKDQWQSLQQLYGEVSDPRVVEHVIHQIIATEKRYGYLLQLAKEQHLHCGDIEIR